MKLSERQQRTIAAALTVIAGFVMSAAVLGLFWVLGVFTQTFAHVFLPLAVAGIAALVFQPYFKWLRAKLPLPLAVASLLSSIILPVALFVGFFGVVVIREMMALASEVPGWWDRLQPRLSELIPEVEAFFRDVPMGQKLAQSLQNIGPWLATGVEYFITTSAAASSNVAAWVSGLLSWTVAPVYFVFFLIMDRGQLGRVSDQLAFLKPQTRDDVEFLGHEFINIIVSFFRGQFVIAFLQGLLLSVGFKIVGLKYGLVLGFVIGFLNVIPYLGSMTGLAITLPLAFFQQDGGLGTLAAVIVCLLVVQVIEGYLLTPKIMGDRTGLHPMAIMVAVFFWGSALGGIMGMILAIPLTAFLVVFWRLAKEKYIPEVV